jgi:ribulose-phosphate 3-epimerase
MPDVTVIPTVLAFTWPEFEQRLARTLPIADEIQIDFMDGAFVETKSIALEQAPDVARHAGKRFEAHLMVADPQAWIAAIARKGFARCIFHYEAVGDARVEETAAFIRSHGMDAVLAFNPDTAVERAAPHARYVDGMLVMGVSPGRNHAPYVAQTPERVRTLAELMRSVSIPIQVDGGMTPQTIRAVVHAGASRINSGSFVANARDPKEALEQLRAAAR